MCFSIFILLQSLVSLAGVIRFSLYALRKKPSRPNRYQPKAVVIVPCRGLDHDFEDNIRSYLIQEYRDYEIILVTESESDPAYGVLTKLIKSARHPVWMVVSGDAQDQGQKVHNLCAAIDLLNAVDRRTEVLVFADSDAHVDRKWLAELVNPLGDKRVGATTGFRWYLPAHGQRWLGGRFASILLSIWNSSALSLLGERSGFAWGGSTAIRRETFDKLGIKDRWRGAVSDDYVLSSAVKESGKCIKFVPRCLVRSNSDSTLSELLEFTTRQMRITRVYSPRIWKLACFSHCLYNITLWTGLVRIVSGGYRGAGAGHHLIAWLLLGIVGLGAMSGWIRVGVAADLLPAERERAQRVWWAFVLLGPVISLLYLYNILASLGTRRIIWRGIGYEMISPSETLVLDRPADTDSDTRKSKKKRKRDIKSQKS
ncbi:MAG: glycosyltransferase, partial [Blastocatellia bacterium]|nr:glycosyltransferase [Blastocatellia bacterium]